MYLKCLGRKPELLLGIWRTGKISTHRGKENKTDTTAEMTQIL